MREQLKQQFKDMITTLERGEAVLYSRIRDEDGKVLNQLFEDMQSSAIAIGEAIEQVEGEGSDTVKHLENYCELLWRYMIEDDINERFHLAGQLAGEREGMLASLDGEFAGRLEIVFLVCRGASWKGMERFYDIMKDQADCIVLTAPYLECKAGGPEAGDEVLTGESAGEPDAANGELKEDPAAAAGAGQEGTEAPAAELVMIRHDESGMLPEEVEVIGFEEYDFEERKPDMVFVDGPFVEPGQPGDAPGYDFSFVRENAGLVLYLPCYEDAGQFEEAHCRTVQAGEADIILVPSEEISRAYTGVMGQMKGGRRLIKKLYVLEKLDGKRLLEKGKFR